MANGLNGDQDRHSVGPDLSPNCFGRQQSPVHVARKGLIRETAPNAALDKCRTYHASQLKHQR